jgi:hypothetical protein
VLERADWAPWGAIHYREVYRGPDRAYNDFPAESASLTWLYRIRAGASGKAGTWSESVTVTFIRDR